MSIRHPQALLWQTVDSGPFSSLYCMFFVGFSEILRRWKAAGKLLTLLAFARILGIYFPTASAWYLKTIGTKLGLNGFELKVNECPIQQWVAPRVWLPAFKYMKHCVRGLKSPVSWTVHRAKVANKCLENRARPCWGNPPAYVWKEKGPGGTPGNSWRGCAARFSKSWPCFRPKNVILNTRFQTRPLKCATRKFFGFELPKDPFPGFLIHSDRILASSILLGWSLANWRIISSRLISMLYVGYGARFQLGGILYN